MMWRLLVVLALCGVSLVQGEEITCNNITTVQNLSLNELQGTWVARKSFEWGRRIDEPRRLSCLLNEVTITSDTSLKMEAKDHRKWEEEEDRRVKTENMQLKVIGDNKGRWITENVRRGKSVEVRLVSADPSSYIVLAMCGPERRVANEDNLNDIERSVFRVLIFARRQGSGGSGNLSEENLAKITDNTIKTLGLENYQEDHNFETDC